MTREDFLAHCLATYGTSPDYPFADDLHTAVLRHATNGKWYALVMRLAPKRLGLTGEGHLDVVNLKLPVEMCGSFSPEDGVYPAYHMNKLHWVSVVLGEATDRLIQFLLHASYQITKEKKGRRECKKRS